MKNGANWQNNTHSLDVKVVTDKITRTPTRRLHHYQ